MAVGTYKETSKWSSFDKWEFIKLIEEDFCPFLSLKKPSTAMRQLKGKPKETNKQKKERKKDFLENKKKVFTVVLPSLAAIFFLIVVYVYLKTKPKISVEM